MRGLPRLRAPDIVPCIISFSRQVSGMKMAGYFDKRVGVSVSVSVRLSNREHIISGTKRPIFTKFLRVLLMAVAHSSSGVAMRFVLPVSYG